MEPSMLGPSAASFEAVAKAQAIGSQDLGRKELAAHVRAALLAGDIVVAGQELRLDPVAPSIGTIVHGADLSKPFSPEMLSFVKRLWLDRKVIMFRGQAHLTRAQHMAFAEQFGVLGADFGERDWIPDAATLDGALTSRLPDAPDMVQLHANEAQPYAAEEWHSDVMWSWRPPMASALICRTPPAVGGDTCFCDAYAMLEALRPEVRRRLEGLSALNVGTHLHAIGGTKPFAVHPCVRTHPETGGKALYVSPFFTQKILDVPEEESEAILHSCLTQVGRQEFVARFRWEAGSLALWDNRACFHKAVADFWPHTRHMERVTLLDPDESLRAPYLVRPHAEPREWSRARL